MDNTIIDKLKPYDFINDDDDETIDEYIDNEFVESEDEDDDDVVYHPLMNVFYKLIHNMFNFFREIVWRPKQALHRKTSLALLLSRDH